MGIEEQVIEVQRLSPDAWRIAYRGLHLTLDAQAMRELLDALLVRSAEFSEDERRQTP